MIYWDTSAIIFKLASGKLAETGQKRSRRWI